jgi:hypothetical protein
MEKVVLHIGKRKIANRLENLLLVVRVDRKTRAAFSSSSPTQTSGSFVKRGSL